MDATNERRCTIALKSIAKSLERIATAMEKENAPSEEGQGQTTKKYFLHGTKKQSGEDRKNLANAIREILLDQTKEPLQDLEHRSKQQPCPTEHKPGLDE